MRGRSRWARGGAAAEVSVLFRGHTHTRTNVAEIVRREREPAGSGILVRESEYASGWICDGCLTRGAGPARGSTE